LRVQPIRRSAARTRRALAEGHWLTDRPVSKNARQFRHFREPAAVVLALRLDAQLHGTSLWAWPVGQVYCGASKAPDVAVQRPR
jgi:hypothetical protein